MKKREKEWDVELGHSKQFCGYFKFLLQFTGTPSKTRAVKKIFGHTHKKNQKHWMLIESINLHKNLKIAQSFQFTLNIMAWTYWHINLFGIRKVCMRKIQKFNKLGVHQSIVEMKLQDIVMFCTVDTFLKGFKWKLQCFFWVRWTCLVWLWKHKESLLVEVEFK